MIILLNVLLAVLTTHIGIQRCRAQVRDVFEIDLAWPELYARNVRWYCITPLVIAAAVLNHYLFPNNLVMALASTAFVATLLVLAAIDAETMFLPDCLTLPLLWAGLLVNLSANAFVSLENAVLGAAVGYLLPWCIQLVFRVLAKSESLGYGDLKLSAALGAWVGWDLIPAILLLATLLSIVVMWFKSRTNKHMKIAFGPYLSISGVTTFWFVKININY